MSQIVKQFDHKSILARPVSTAHGECTPRPFISIGVTTYNRPQLLKQTLNSILRQTFTDFEVIVGNDYVDGPLTADDLDIYDSRLRIINHPRNLGEIGNMNALLELSRGEYFVWQFDDDLYAECFLEAVHCAITQFGGPPAIFTAFKTIHSVSELSTEDIQPTPPRLFSGSDLLAQYWRGDLKIMAHAGVYKRSFLVDNGGVEQLTDSPFGLFSEYLLLIRTGLLDQVAFIDSPLAIYRIHEGSWGSTTRDLALMQQACLNLTRRGLALLSQQPLRQDFNFHSVALLKLCVKNYLWKCRTNSGEINRLRAVPLWLRLGRELSVVRNIMLCGKALRSWIWVGIKQIWWPYIRYRVHK